MSKHECKLNDCIVFRRKTYETRKFGSKSGTRLEHYVVQIDSVHGIMRCVNEYIVAPQSADMVSVIGWLDGKLTRVDGFLSIDEDDFKQGFLVHVLDAGDVKISMPVVTPARTVSHWFVARRDTPSGSKPPVPTFLELNGQEESVCSLDGVSRAIISLDNQPTRFNGWLYSIDRTYAEEITGLVRLDKYRYLSIAKDGRYTVLYDPASMADYQAMKAKGFEVDYGNN